MESTSRRSTRFSTQERDPARRFWIQPLEPVMTTLTTTSLTASEDKMSVGGAIADACLSHPRAMAQLAYIIPNKVFKPHLIAAALLLYKFSTTSHATIIASNTKTFEI
jgi:hypothetical protein